MPYSIGKDTKKLVALDSDIKMPINLYKEIPTI